MWACAQEERPCCYIATLSTAVCCCHCPFGLLRLTLLAMCTNGLCTCQMLVIASVSRCPLSSAPAHPPHPDVHWRRVTSGLPGGSAGCGMGSGHSAGGTAPAGIAPYAAVVVESTTTCTSHGCTELLCQNGHEASTAGRPTGPRSCCMLLSTLAQLAAVRHVPS